LNAEIIGRKENKNECLLSLADTAEYLSNSINLNVEYIKPAK